jgi:hypothetical protein
MAINKIPVFISFDYDHDATLKDFLVGQAKERRLAVLHRGLVHQGSVEGLEGQGQEQDQASRPGHRHLRQAHRHG